MKVVINFGVCGFCKEPDRHCEMNDSRCWNYGKSKSQIKRLTIQKKNKKEKKNEMPKL